MRIGELAKRTGLAASRIRFYETEGLISAVKRSGNGYREYSEQAELSLILILRAQKAGFTLEEIRHLLPTDLDDWQHDQLLDALKRKVAEIEELQTRLQQSKAQLLATIDSIENRPEGMGCADNARRLLKAMKPAQTGAASETPLIEAVD
ncbi:MerR family transcriptional regulator [Pseudomonas sp. NPDC090202]|uniref:MerR family transcriptional regulator n=1 Tax=unclassified Pseudomonas TaxID=196821 RepID=UPI00381F12B5